MAKRKVNKSKMIRELIDAGKESPQEIADLLTAKGVKTSPQEVSTTKSRYQKQQSSTGKAGKKKARKKKGQRTGNGSILGAIESAFELIEQAGGADEAKKVIDRIAVYQ